MNKRCHNILFRCFIFFTFVNPSWVLSMVNLRLFFVYMGRILRMRICQIWDLFRTLCQVWFALISSIWKSNFVNKRFMSTIFCFDMWYLYWDLIGAQFIESRTIQAENYFNFSPDLFGYSKFKLLRMRGSKIRSDPMKWKPTFKDLSRNRNEIKNGKNSMF